MQCDSGGVLRNISAYVTEDFDFPRESVMQNVTAAGDDDEAHAPVGLKKVGDVTLRGPYNDDALGLTVIGQSLLGLTTSSTLKVTWKSGKTSTVECFASRFTRAARKGQFTGTELVLKPTGAVTKA